MSTLLHTTRDALGGSPLPACTSRSLRLTRYAEPTLNDKPQPTRKQFLESVIAAKDQRHDDGLNSWRGWLSATVKPEHLLHAKLEARLLINMGGTVLENAGLQLDRFGTAYLPGSAVKACARRTALATLRQWCETGVKPAAADSDALALACAHSEIKTPADLLLAILRVFGCTDLEWGHYNPEPKSKDKNDLAWACANQWPTLRDTARTALAKLLAPGSELPAPSSKLAAPTLRGSVSFLPAYPYSRFAEDLELDVLTSHHQTYYGSNDPNAVATDTENPIPVYFPSVTAGAVYTFAILPVGSTATDSPLITHARTWLQVGLETFGLGAKTAAGYGFFSDQTATINTELKTQQAAAQLAAARTTLAPDTKLLSELKTKKPDQLRGLINGFAVDAKFWTNKDESFQLTLLHFATSEDRALYDAEKANAKSKIIAGLRNLAAKFNRTLPA